MYLCVQKQSKKRYEAESFPPLAERLRSLCLTPDSGEWNVSILHYPKTVSTQLFGKDAFEITTMAVGRGKKAPTPTLSVLLRNGPFY